MARSTPTYTPARNYIFGIFLSAALLFSDINYDSFSLVRSSFKASTLYVQMLSNALLEALDNSVELVNSKQILLEENKNLQDQILKLKTKDFLKREDLNQKIDVINLHQDLTKLVSNNQIQLFKIASVDLKNYLCCSTHRLFLKNPDQLKIERNQPVLAGKSFIGQTRKSKINFIEVILLSDTSHIIPVKTDFFYCDARGNGKPLKISCSINPAHSEFKPQIGDAIFTSGLGGIFIQDIQVGAISEIKSISIDEIEISIKLTADPLKENFFGIMNSEFNEL